MASRIFSEFLKFIDLSHFMRTESWERERTLFDYAASIAESDSRFIRCNGSLHGLCKVGISDYMASFLAIPITAAINLQEDVRWMCVRCQHLGTTCQMSDASEFVRVWSKRATFSRVWRIFASPARRPDARSFLLPLPPSLWSFITHMDTFLQMVPVPISSLRITTKIPLCSLRNL